MGHKTTTVVLLAVLFHLVLLAVDYSLYFSVEGVWSPATWPWPLRDHAWVLFAGAAALCGVGLWKPRWWVFVLLGLMLIVLQQRNLWISSGGDKLLVYLMFWVALLQSAQGRCFVPVRIAFVVQLAVIYGQNALFKLLAQGFDGREALNLVLIDSGLTASFAQNLAGSWVTGAATLLTIAEFVGAVLLFTRRWRWPLVGFVAYHLMIGVGLKLGSFSIVMLAWWAVLFAVKTTDDRSGDFCPTAFLAVGWAFLGIAQSILIPVSKPRRVLLETLYLKQNWSMFAAPRTAQADLVIECQRDGSVQACPASFSAWSDRRQWDGRRHAVVSKLVYRAGSEELRDGLLHHLCRRSEGSEAVTVSARKTVYGARTLRPASSETKVLQRLECPRP